jgi:hypothetical protein
MIHNPDNRSCDSGTDSEEGDIQRSDLLYVPILSFFGSGNPNEPDRRIALNALRSGGKSGVFKTRRNVRIPPGLFRRVNHYIGNMTNPVQPFR